jgi:hypothetical protein
MLSLCLINYLANERLNEWEIIRPTVIKPLITHLDFDVAEK